MTSQPAFQTDSLRPTSLPSANLGRRILGSAATEASALASAPTTDVDLDRTAEDWNVRIDRELKSLVGGLKELVRVADLTSSPPPLSEPLLPLHLSLQTASLIRSAQNLRDMAHELKLLLLLGDEAATAHSRDAEAAHVALQVERARSEAVAHAVTVFASEDDGGVDVAWGSRGHGDGDGAWHAAAAGGRRVTRGTAAFAAEEDGHEVMDEGEVVDDGEEDGTGAAVVAVDTGAGHQAAGRAEPEGEEREAEDGDNDANDTSDAHGDNDANDASDVNDANDANRDNDANDANRDNDDSGINDLPGAGTLQPDHDQASQTSDQEMSIDEDM